MTPSQYFDPLLGQSLLYPGQSEGVRGQCVQSVMYWIKENGTEPPVYGSAYQYYTQGVPGYTKIPVGNPIQDGDIVVYGSAFPVTKGNGHIDVATGSGTNRDYWAYDQNWQPLIVTKTHHNGSDNQYIIGYLRKEVEIMSVVNDGDTINEYRALFDRDPTQAELDKNRGKEWNSPDPNLRAPLYTDMQGRGRYLTEENKRLQKLVDSAGQAPTILTEGTYRVE